MVKRVTNKYIKPDKKNIGVTVLPEFNKNDLQYFLENGINSKEILQKYGIYSINSVKINGKTIWIRTDNNIIIGYYLPKLKKIKCHKPITKEYISNFNSSILFGLDQLPEKGNLLLFTKSPKEVIFYAVRGINAICPNTENTLLTDLPIEILEDLKNRFDQVIVNFDDDKIGQQYSKIYSDYFNTDPFFTSGAKDITDFYKEFGETKTNELLKIFL